MPIPTISATVITKNEAHDIRTCLESIKWVDEIIVLDSGSNDGTQDICREYTDKVFATDWPGYGVQKNRAVEKATSDWVLSIDADEIISETLRKEIRKNITIDRHNAYKIPRRSKFCGKTIKFGVWRGEKPIRLFKKGFARFNDHLVHESLVIKDNVGKLSSYLLHNTYRDLEEVIEKINLYSTAGAEMRLSQGKRGGLSIALLHSFWGFFRSYVLYAGFLDGKEGYILAVSIAQTTFYRYLKLMYMRKRRIED